MPNHQPRDQTGSPPGPAFLVGLTEEQMARLAEMIADGRCEFPQDLHSSDAQRLGRRVSLRLRSRLIHFIARAIADHLSRARSSPPEAPEHA